jgi:hypothetical protein
LRLWQLIAVKTVENLGEKEEKLAAPEGL